MRQAWVFKRDRGDYLHSFEIGRYGRIEEPKYIEFQAFAWRFVDRNAASTIAVELKEAGSLKRLLPSGTSKRLAKIEEELLANRKALTMALAADMLARDSAGPNGGEAER